MSLSLATLIHFQSPFELDF